MEQKPLPQKYKEHDLKGNYKGYKECHMYYRITIFQKTAILMFLYLLINRAGSIASALLSGAIASIGIGSQMGAQGFSNAVSTPGRFAGNMANSASRFSESPKYQGGAKAFRRGSYAAETYKKAADGVKNFASRFK